MKKLLSVLLCVTGSTAFFACQKTYDIPAAEIRSGEIMSTSAGDVAMESAVSDCGQFRTQSQGGWGASPSGNNPGTYLHANFANAFPSGLTVGCSSGGYSVHYSSASAITEFLPAGGNASVLTENATDPSNKSIKNVLIGQVTALALSVGFDYYDVNFAAADANLANLVINSGPFAGKSVAEFLDIANMALGGCATTGYSYTELNETADLINQSFLDAAIDSGFLSCPTVRFGER